MMDDTLSDTNDNTKTAKVLPFKKVTPKVAPSDHNAPNPAIVKLFEDYLKKAKAGKLRFVGIAAVDEAGVAYSTWEPPLMEPTEVTDALGAASYLNARITMAAVDGEVGHLEP